MKRSIKFIVLIILSLVIVAQLSINSYAEETKKDKKRPKDKESAEKAKSKNGSNLRIGLANFVDLSFNDHDYITYEISQVLGMTIKSLKDIELIDDDGISQPLGKNNSKNEPMYIFLNNVYNAV